MSQFHFGRPSQIDRKQSFVPSQKGKKIPKFFEETEAFVLSSYGGLLPIAAKDNLKNAVSSSGLIDETSGNILFVSSRNIYLWSLKMGEHGIKKFSLPASALAITRNHISISVFPKSVALVCVTPSGCLRYWKTLACPNAFTEVSLPLRDQEVFAAIQVTFEKVVIGTTNCTILFVDKNMASRELKLTVKGGFTSRLASMTSYFIPSSSAQEEVEQMKALLVPIRSETCVLAVSNTNLYLINFQEEKLVWCINVADSVKPYMEFADVRNISVLNANYWGDESDLILLISFRSGAETPSYAFAHLSFDPIKTPEFSVNIFPFDIASILSSSNFRVDLDACEMQFPFPKFCDGYLVLQNGILHLSSIFTENQEDSIASVVDFSLSEDKVVAFGAYQGTMLLLMAKKGLISFVSKNEQQYRECQSATALQRSLREIFEMYSAEPDQQLKQLLLLYRRAKSSKNFLSAAEPFVQSLSSCVNLDAIVYDCALSIANGYLNYNDALTSTATLNIENVLQEKIGVMTVFLDFLEQSKMANQLKSLEELPHLGLKQIFPTLLAVCRIFENMGCMQEFYKLHCTNQALFDPFIHVAVQNRGTHSNAGDITLNFYKIASNFEEIFDLIAHAQKGGTLESNFDNAITIMRLYIASFERIFEIRKQNEHLRVTEKKICFWNLSETFADYIKTHFDWLKLNVDLFSSNVTTIELLQCHYDFAVSCLQSYGEFCKLLSQAEEETEELYLTMESKVKDMRSLFISFFAEMNQPTFALGLAEKFLDFETLISICLNNKDLTKLSSYRKLFRHKEFDTYLIKTLYDQKNIRALITLDSPYLATFLKEMPQLRWAVEARQKEWTKATETLLELTSEHGHSFTFHKKKTLMSFAKMYALLAHYKKDSIVFQEIDWMFHVAKIQVSC